MCSIKAPDAEPVPRYAQQRTPTSRDGEDAQKRADQQRRRATSTLLAKNVGALDTSGAKTLLGGG